MNWSSIAEQPAVHFCQVSCGGNTSFSSDTEGIPKVKAFKYNTWQVFLVLFVTVFLKHEGAFDSVLSIAMCLMASHRLGTVNNGRQL